MADALHEEQRRSGALAVSPKRDIALLKGTGILSHTMALNLNLMKQLLLLSGICQIYGIHYFNKKQQTLKENKRIY
ncbi:hypothetical protein SESBI_31897 [Sesbania bispinosa]|nr:hypothetical protein SESBI_31897 [Sesbania bispinosa]